MDRKHSIQSEDSDMLGSTLKTVQDHPRRPNITIRQETTSTESPLEISDDQTLVGDGSAEDIVDMNFEGKLNNNRSSLSITRTLRCNFSKNSEKYHSNVYKKLCLFY